MHMHTHIIQRRNGSSPLSYLPWLLSFTCTNYLMALHSPHCDSDVLTSPAERRQALILRCWHSAQRGKRPGLTRAHTPSSKMPGSCQSSASHTCMHMGLHKARMDLRLKPHEAAGIVDAKIWQQAHWDVLYASSISAASNISVFSWVNNHTRCTQTNMKWKRLMLMCVSNLILLDIHCFNHFSYATVYSFFSW